MFRNVNGYGAEYASLGYNGSFQPIFLTIKMAEYLSVTKGN